MWHDLDKKGNITKYDVMFEGRVIFNISASDLIPEGVQEHYHETRE